MKFDNQDTVYGIHSLKLVMAVVVVIFIIIMLLTSVSEYVESAIGINQNWLIAIVILAYLMFFGYFLWQGAAYVSYNDEESKLVIRTFKLRPWGSKKISMEIPHSELYKYEISAKWPRKELHIYVKKGNKIMKYPPVSVVSLTSKRYSDLVASLDKLTK